MLIGIMEPETEQRELLEKTAFQYYCSDADIDYCSFKQMDEMIFYSENHQVFDIAIIRLTGEHKEWTQAVRELYARNKHMMVIYIADDYTYVHDAITLQAFQYMIGPVKGEKLRKELDRAIRRYRRRHSKYVISTRTDRYVVDHKDVIYIERLNNHLYAYTSKKTYDYIGSIKEEEEKLKAYNFIKVHRAFLVNLAHIEAVTGDKICLKNGIELFVSRSCRKEVRERIAQYHRPQAI